MDNLNLNLILKPKTNDATELFFKKENCIESIKLKEPVKLGKVYVKKEKIYDKNSSNEEIFKQTQELMRNVIQNGCLSILTFGQKNFIYSSEESNGILIKIGREIFEFSDQNKDLKVELKFTCIDDQFNDILDRRSTYEKTISKNNRTESLNETLVTSFEKFKILLKQIEVLFKSKNLPANKNYFYKFSIEITKKFSSKKSVSNIYVFDISESLNESNSKPFENKNYLALTHEILKALSEEKQNSNIPNKFDKLLQITLNKTYLTKGLITLFVFLSQKAESIETLENAKKILKLKTSVSSVATTITSMKPSLATANETPITMQIDSSHEEQNAEIISNLENEVSFLKKMILKKETDDYYKMSTTTHPKSYLMDSGLKYKGDMFLKNNLLPQANPNHPILRSNTKNLLNSSYHSTKVNPYLGLMSNSKLPYYGYNPENEFDFPISCNEGLFAKENRLGYEDIHILKKENEELKCQLAENKKTFSELIKEKENSLKALYNIIQGHEQTIKETEINYNEINLQYKQLLEELSTKENEIACLKERAGNTKQLANSDVEEKLKEILQNNERINTLYNKEMLKNNNLYIENEKLLTDLHKIKANCEKIQTEMNKTTSEFNANKTKITSLETEVTSYRNKNLALSNEIYELKKKIEFFKKKQQNSSEKTSHETSKSGKVCKCEFYEKKILSQIEEINKLQKELKEIKSKKIENIKKETSQEKDIGKEHLIEYEKIIEESLSQIKELQQSLNATQEKNDYLEKLLLKKEKENANNTSDKPVLSSISTNKKFKDFDLITPFSYKQEDDDSLLDEINNMSENGFTKKKRKIKNNDLNEILGIVNFHQDDKEII